MKCPLNNFADCDPDCAWYLKEPKCCAVKRISYLTSVNNLVELKSIARDISSIDDTLTRSPRNSK